MLYRLSLNRSTTLPNRIRNNMNLIQFAPHRHMASPTNNPQLFKRDGFSWGYNALHFVRNDKPWLPVMGEFQYSRYPHQEWEREILKLKAAGIDIVATYMFWHHHEEERGVFDWSGRRDIRCFVELCREHGLWVALRVGPFCHGEARNGGLPDWLYGQPFPVRSNDERYLCCVRRYFNEIGRNVSGLMFAEGGPVIMVQLENEFMDSVAPWETTHFPNMDFTPAGSGEIEHLYNLRSIARDAGMDVPVYTATGWGKSPINTKDFLPVFGAYAFHGWLNGDTPQEPTGSYLFYDGQSKPHPKYDPSEVPYICCELGGGMQSFYRCRPVVPAASVEAMHTVWLGSGVNLPGYYVFHGGSNPTGAKSFLNENRCPRISYDFQAPISEFGQLRESYHRCRRQFLFLQTWGELLAEMPVTLPSGKNINSPQDDVALRCSLRQKEGSGFIFVNNYQDHYPLSPKSSLNFAVSKDGKELRFPSGDMRFDTDVCAILPFGINMNGIELLYSTVQPITSLSTDHAVHYFFFAPKGISPELAFDAHCISEARMISGIGKIDRAMETLLLTMEADKDNTVELFSNEGNRITITVLSDPQSLAFWKGRLAGKEHVFISTADLVFGKDSMQIKLESGKTNEIFIFPALARSFSRENSLFQRFEVVSNEVSITPQIEKLSPGKYLLRVSTKELEMVDEAIIKIDYIGDVASGYINGQLVCDDFSNGLPWEIDIKRFCPKNGDLLEMVLVILPKHQKDGPRFTADQMASIKAVETDGDCATINSTVDKYYQWITLKD